MHVNPIQTIMNPKSIVYLGGSNSLSTIGTAQLVTILKSGYQGKIYPIHRKEKEVIGLKAYPNISSLNKPVDLAVLVIPGKAVRAVLDECGRAGIKHAIIITAGYGETGKNGKKAQEDLIRIAQKYGIRFLGPNCIGIINSRIGLNTTWFPEKYSPGHVGIISQSGSYVTQTLNYFEKIGMGISQAISIGNQADIDMVDCLEYLGRDDQTRSIALYIEGIKRPVDFLKVAREITAKKPIIAVSAGGTEAGARANASHTGSMGSPDKLYRGLFQQAGILRANDVTELFDWSLALSSQPLPKGKSFAVLTNSGGPGSSMADAAERNGLHIPIFSSKVRNKIKAMIPSAASSVNPVDVTMNYDLGLIFKKLPNLILNLKEIDGMLFYGIFGPVHFKDKIAMTGNTNGLTQELLEETVEKICIEFCNLPKKSNKPIFCASFTGREDSAVALIQDHGIPVYPTPERAVSAMAALWEYRKIKNRYKLRPSGGNYGNHW